MIEKRTVLNKREIVRNGIVYLQFCKEIVDDGEIISSEYHRAAIEPGVDVDFVLSEVDRHLASMKCAAVGNSCKDKIRSTVRAEHTKDVVTKYQAAKADAIEENAKLAPTK